MKIIASRPALIAGRLLFCLALFCSAAAIAAPTFFFTAIPDEDESRLQARFNKTAAYLSQSLHIDVQYVPVKSYPAAVTAFRNNAVQLAWFGGLTGVQARRATPGAQAIAQGAEDAAFVTWFIAHASTGLKPAKEFPQAIAGKSFLFGAKTSTSGRLMPEFYIREHLQAAPDTLFSRVGYSGDHTKTLELVASGAWQIGALNHRVFQDALQTGRIDPKKVTVIWKTPGYPDYQWTIRGDVDATWGKGFSDKVQQALLNMKDRELLDSFGRSAFIKARNADYMSIEKTAQAIGLLDE